MKQELKKGYTVIVEKENEELKGKYFKETIDGSCELEVNKNEIGFIQNLGNIVDYLEQGETLQFYKEGKVLAATIGKIEKTDTNTEYLMLTEKVSGTSFPEVLIDLDTKLLNNKKAIDKTYIKGEKYE